VGQLELFFLSVTLSCRGSGGYDSQTFTSRTRTSTTLLELTYELQFRTLLLLPKRNAW